MPRRRKITAAEAVANVLPPPAGADPDPATVTFRLTPKPEVLRKIVENPPPRPSVQAFLDHWFALRGGSAQFARDLCQEYDAADPGSMIRSQIIQLVVRSMKVADVKEGSMDELGLVTDADLDRLIDTVGDKIVADAATATPPPT